MEETDRPKTLTPNFKWSQSQSEVFLTTESRGMEQEKVTSTEYSVVIEFQSGNRCFRDNIILFDKIQPKVRCCHLRNPPTGKSDPSSKSPSSNS